MDDKLLHEIANNVGYLLNKKICFCDGFMDNFAFFIEGNNKPFKRTFVDNYALKTCGVMTLSYRCANNLKKHNKL